MEQKSVTEKENIIIADKGMEKESQIGPEDNPTKKLNANVKAS